MTRIPEGWVCIPKVGTWVIADHPITIGNPSKFFKVEELKYNEEKISFFVRARSTIWFNCSKLKPALKNQASECGFDTTNFGSANRFKEIMNYFKLEYLGRDFDRNNSFIFAGPNITIWTTNNPITGEYFMGDNVRGRQPGFAAYIGIQGEASEVRRCANLILDRCHNHEQYDPKFRSFI